MSQKNLKGSSAFLLISLIVCLSSYVYFKKEKHNYESITSFRECLSSGYPISTTYPETCSVPGKVFVNEDQTQKSSNNVNETIERNPFLSFSYQLGTGAILEVKNGEVVLSPYVIRVEATSTAYFSGDFIKKDFNNDNKEDAVFLAKVTDGSEYSPYYGFLSIALNNGYIGGGMVPLGKIKNPKIEIDGDFLVINFETESGVNEKRYNLSSGILK